MHQSDDQIYIYYLFNILHRFCRIFQIKLSAKCQNYTQSYNIHKLTMTKTNYAPLFSFITIDEKSSMVTVQATEQIPVQSYAVIIKVVLKNSNNVICNINDYIVYYFNVTPSTTPINTIEHFNNISMWIWFLIIILVLVLAYYIFKNYII